MEARESAHPAYPSEYRNRARTSQRARENRPPWNHFSNIWFRKNIFWKNTGPTGMDAGPDAAHFHFVNNLWDKPYAGDLEAKYDHPPYVDPDAHGPERYKIGSVSAARGRGLPL